MSDPIGALTRTLGELQQKGLEPGDTGARQIPIVGNGSLGPSFSDTLTDALNGISEVRDNAGEMTRRFLAGDNVELHQVMAAQEEAGVALDLLIEMRNKMVESYRTLVNMQS